MARTLALVRRRVTSPCVAVPAEEEAIERSAMGEYGSLSASAVAEMLIRQERPISYMYVLPTQNSKREQECHEMTSLEY
jgi:hypothetical protein